jgi:hypothetical protein
MLGRRESLREVIRNEQEKTREFNREILLRNEKVYTSVIAEMEKNGEQIVANTEETRENAARTRAGTEAILKLLDRFEGSGGATA